MINLDERYHDYLHTDKCFTIDNVCEHVTGYGFTCDGKEINGYYVLTNNHKLFYNLKEKFLKMESRKGGRVVECISLEN
ncbi:MAG: hypothetical protein CMO46_08225 [Verrucomicrobiales bacterium]|nr:hypothetical protein [Verrucomicrobiales bacterium]|tara:strand:+ start:436 stop:672 length:237 start_codon:yes stop_codon:yes gene_type:complete